MLVLTSSCIPAVAKRFRCNTLDAASMQYMEEILNDLVTELIRLYVQVCKEKEKSMTITVHTLQCAVWSLIPGSIGRYAVVEGRQAINSSDLKVDPEAIENFMRDHMSDLQLANQSVPRYLAGVIEYIVGELVVGRLVSTSVKEGIRKDHELLKLFTHVSGATKV